MSETVCKKCHHEQANEGVKMCERGWGCSKCVYVNCDFPPANNDRKSALKAKATGFVNEWLDGVITRTELSSHLHAVKGEYDAIGSNR